MGYQSNGKAKTTSQWCNYSEAKRISTTVLSNCFSDATVLTGMVVANPWRSLCVPYGPLKRGRGEGIISGDT